MTRDQHLRPQARRPPADAREDDGHDLVAELPFDNRVLVCRVLPNLRKAVAEIARLDRQRHHDADVCRHGSGRVAEVRQCRSKELPFDHFESVAQPAIHAQGRGRLESRVHHAVLAPGVIAVSIVLPGSLGQEVAEGRMMRIGDQVARALSSL